MLLPVLLLALSATGLYAQAPQFTQSLYQTSVNETAVDEGYPRPSNGFLRVTCTGGMNTSYSNSTNDSLPFDIDSSTGDLSVTEDLDYDTGIISYSFTVICSERDSPDLNDTATVEIVLLPVNEFRPQVVGTSNVFVSVPEDTPMGTVIVSNSDTALPGTLSEYTITDNDAGIDGLLTFISTELDTKFFSLEIDTGSVVLIRELDRDNQTDPAPANFEPVSVTGCDFFPPIETCPNVNLRIFVVQVNEFTPQFSQDSYSTSIPEDTPEGTEVLVVECTDGDVGDGQFARIEFYNVSQAVMDAFAIDGSNGNITVRAVNYETDQSYEFMVRCIDTGGLEDFAEVTINIDFTPQFSQDSYNASIPEDTPEGTEVLVVECTDGDVGVGHFAGIELYNASQAVVDAFAIDGSFGNITVRAVNYETDQSYEFVVRCIDTSGLEGFAEVTINIEDINDNSPICDTANVPTTLSVRTYSSTALFTLTCSDLDSGQNGLLSYNISISSTIPSSGGTFEIDSMGVVTFTGTAEEGTYTITIRVSNPDGLYTEYEITLTGMSEEEDGSGGAVPFAAIIVPIIVILLIVTFIIILIIIILFLRKRRKDAKNLTIELTGIIENKHAASPQEGWQGEGTREDETSLEEVPQEQQETAVPQGEGVPQEGSAEGVPQEGTGEQKTFPVEEPAYADPQKIKREEFPGTSDLYTIPDKTNKKASEEKSSNGEEGSGDKEIPPGDHRQPGTPVYLNSTADTASHSSQPSFDTTPM